MTQQLDVETRPAPPVPIRPRRWFLAAATAACTGIVLLTHKSITPAIPVTLVLLAMLGALELSRREARNPGDPRPIVWSIAGLYALAIVRPTRFATDIWSYTMVGRILAVHHLNPYRVAPAKLDADPLLPLLHHTWRSGTTPYGPVFVAYSAIVSFVSGAHPLLYRLAFQLTAAAAMALVLWLLWRATHSTAALALIGLHPMVAGSIVNAGHNDAVVALGLLGVVLLLAKGRTHAAGWLLVATALVKITIGFTVLPIAVWTLRRYGRRALVPLLAPAAVVGSLSLLIPGALHSMTNANAGVITRLTIWNIPQRVTWLGLTHLGPAKFTTAGMLVLLVLVVLAAWLGRDQPDAGRGAAVSGAAWLVASSYVLAWYTLLGFVAAGLRPTDRIARWLAVQGGVITAAFLIPRADLTSIWIVGTVVSRWVPIGLAIGFAWALLPLARDARRARATRPPAGDRTSPTATA